MAILKPFKVLHPKEEYAPSVAALPYDVMSREEAFDMAKGNPHSFLRISRAEIDLPGDISPYSPEVYERAKENLQDFIKEGILVREEKPCYFIYRQTMNGRRQTGIVGCAGADEYISGTIKKHENVLKDKLIDRTTHFDVCDANTEPVFLTYPGSATINAVVKKWMAENSPIYDFTTPGGVRQEVWKIDSPEAMEVIELAFEDVPHLYIADGHHRTASAVSVAERRRERNPDFTGEENFNFFMAVCFPAHDLMIMDYNRIVRNPEGISASEILEKIKKAGFEVSKAKKGLRRLNKKHVFGAFIGGEWYIMKASRGIIPDDSVGSLDVSILQKNILGPIFGIEDPSTDANIEFAGGIRGIEFLEKRAGESDATAFALCPPDMEDLLAVADAGSNMPPKSTWFEPKLLSGLFVHEL